MIKILLIFALIFPFASQAATYSEALLQCQAYKTANYTPSQQSTLTCKDYPAGNQQSNNTSPYRIWLIVNNNDASYIVSFPYVNPICTLPYILNPITHTCLDENQCEVGQSYFPALNQCQVPQTCTPPQLYHQEYNNCYTPVECIYPEHDNGFGNCVDDSCPSGQVRSPVNNLCQTPPTCGVTETYDIFTNTCKLYPLNCPKNSHPSSANDKCLPDAPLTCPTGQHDDGTYKCIANDVSACNENQTKGYINGIPQCIPKPNLDTAQQAAQDAADAAKTKQQQSDIDAAAAKAANEALAADPTNPAKQQAAAIANAKADHSKTNSDNASADAQQKANDALIKNTKAIKDAVDEAKEKAHDDAKKAADKIAAQDADNEFDVQLSEQQALQIGTTPSTIPVTNNTILGFSGNGSCPVDKQFTFMGKTYALTYFHICNFANTIRPIFLSIVSASAIAIFLL